MKAFVSSKSQLKHDAVKAAFARLGVLIETIAVPMPSGVNEQPRSLDETYEGALNRHEQLVREVAAASQGNYLVTVESGLFAPRPEHNYFGTTTLVIEKDGERHVGIDVDIEFPSHFTDRVPGEYADLGELVKAEFGATSKDPFPYLTNGKITRQNVIENALYNVLVQFKATSD